MSTTTSNPCECHEIDAEIHRIEDEDIVLKLQSIPISLDFTLIVVQYKDREMFSDELPKDASLVEHNGIYTLTIPQVAPNRIMLSSLFSKKTLVDNHRAEGSGGVWNPRKFRCDNRKCIVECNDTSCGSIIDTCALRFDAICSSTIYCISC